MTEVHAACGDCEAIRPGLVGQPVNTATSLAYVAGAIAVVQGRGARRWWWVAALTGLGLGSIGYHGPGTRAGKLAHDASLPFALAVAGVGTRRPNRGRRGAGLLGAVAGAIWFVSRTESPLCRPQSRWQWHGAWHVLSAVAITTLARGEEGHGCDD